MTSADGDGLGLALTLGLALGVGDAEGLAVGLGVALGVGVGVADGLVVGSLVGVLGSSVDSSVVSSVDASDVGVALGSRSPVRAVSWMSESVDGDGLAVSSSFALLVGSGVGESVAVASAVGEAVAVDNTDGEADGDAAGEDEAVADADGAGVASGDGEVVSSVDSDAVGDGDTVPLGDGSSAVGDGEIVDSHRAGMSDGICHSSVIDALSGWDGSGESSAVGLGSAVSTCSDSAGCSSALAGSVVADNDVTTTAADAAQDTSARSIARSHLPVSAVMCGVDKGK